MRSALLAFCLVLFASAASQAGAVTITFDDIPTGSGLWYYQATYGVGFIDTVWMVADHTASPWGTPRSVPNVLVKDAGIPITGLTTVFQLKAQSGLLYARSVGGYFSTEYGCVLQMIGYGIAGDPVTAPALIGAPDQAWTNAYVGISSSAGQITSVVLGPVTPAALDHFCVDDISVEFVPEPSSLASLSLGLLAAGAGVRRRRRAM